ncbi:mitochondrial 28S ribosomal protein S17, putative [Pediculus humanus corporis]|uniref:Mitochondrial 28S ribosomal protein S17, putative n=1 Tax=Pediculus humanus subsp. corporis TaxID=121224 RepID=E0VQI5_PEDHC|nr:mitochondrial 28S ribosomal protein S17, putative [Pediculus humanus corporis]EEB15641.1 mitochondrial 28S ribosomal protein S17, putative [Pediculus humanus corporis]
MHCLYFNNMALKSGLSGGKDLLLGICLPSLKHNASRINVTKLELDEKLLMVIYLRFFFVDQSKICKTGDVVLVKELTKKLSNLMTHEVIKVIYPLGDVVDPVTGKRVVGYHYRDENEKYNAVFGKAPNAFDYNKAKKRGWQEGKKDFSHRQVYLKYNEFEKGDENEEQPFSIDH